VISRRRIQGPELKARGKILPNQKLEDYSQDFTNMLEKMEAWVILEQVILQFCDLHIYYILSK
jgi:hypothetical protein